MKRENKMYIIILLMITILSLTYGIKYISKSKNEELPEVKLKSKIEKEKTFAVMIQNGDKYQEYEGEKWPDNDEYVFTKSECVDNNGNVTDNLVTFDDNSKQLTLNTNKTIFCTIYFDRKYNYLKVPLHSVETEQSNENIPEYMSDKIKHVYFVDYIKSDLSEDEKGVSWWDISDTTKGTSEKGVVVWTEAISNDFGYNNLYVGSEKKMRALSLEKMFAVGTFYRAFDSNLESIDFNNQLDTSITMNLDFMFSDNQKLTKIKGMENWNTSKLSVLSFAFFNCSMLSDFSSLSKWDVSNVTDMYGVFTGSSLNDLTPFSSWQIDKAIDIQSMFSNTKITDTTPINNWNTSKVINMSGLFAYCFNLNTVNLNNWNTSNVTNVSYMFQYSPNITTIDLSNATFIQITNYTDMFFGVPSTVMLTVKDVMQKNWLQSYPKFSGTINVKN